MTSEALYLRVPSATKQRLERLAVERELSLAKVVGETLEDGLSGTGIELRQERELRSAAELRAEAADRELRVLRERLETRELVIGPLFDRLAVEVGACPHDTCGVSVSGRDVFVEGRCGAGHGLHTMLTKPGQKATLNKGELISALATVGLVLAVFAAATKTTTTI